MRAWRNTVVRFGLLSVPVSLSPLVGGSPVEGHTYGMEDGKRVARAWTTDGTTIIPNDETETRYSSPDRDPVALDIVVQGTTGIDLEAAVHVGDVDASLYDSSYAVNPGKDAPRSLATLAAVLRDSGTILVGTARFTESASAKSVVLRWSPLTKGVVLETLHPLARVRVDEARKAASEDEPTKAEYVQGETFVQSLPDILPTLVVQDERDAKILEALAALPVETIPEDDETKDATEIVSDFVSAGYEAAKAKREAKDAEDATVAS